MNLTNPFVITFTIATMLLAASCQTKTAVDPQTLSEGIPSEVLVVCEEDKKETAKEAFAKSYKDYEDILTIAEEAEQQKKEPSYSFWFVGQNAYQGSERNASLIVVLDQAGDFSKDLKALKPSETQAKNGFTLYTYSNVWAKPQTVVYVETHGANLSSLLANGLDHALAGLLRKNEISQGFPGNLATNHYTDSVYQLIAKNYGFGFKFPPQFNLAFSNSEIIWLKQETGSFYRHLFINIFSDSVKLDSMTDAIANRNAFTRKYIQNTEGTKVLVSNSNLFPKEYSTDASGTKILRGWYQEEGTPRRGPFVRYIFHDLSNKRYIALDGFVFAPDSKRNSFYRLFDIIGNTFTLTP